MGTGSVFAWLDRPETPVATVVEEPSPSADGVDEARSNLQRAGLLDGGVGQLTEGSTQLDDGARQLSDGLRQARDGGEQLADGLGQLDGGVDMLGDGARQVSGGVDEVVDRLSGFGEMQGDVTARLTTVADTLGASADPVSLILIAPTPSSPRNSGLRVPVAVTMTLLPWTRTVPVHPARCTRQYLTRRPASIRKGKHHASSSRTSETQPHERASPSDVAEYVQLTAHA